MTEENRISQGSDRRIAVIFNPTARGEASRKWLPFLHGLKHQCTLLPTLEAGDARILASQAVRDGFETVVAAGGDGTVNEVLNGITDTPGGIGNVRLGVLPMGTVNVFAREVGLPHDPVQAWNAIQSGLEVRIDIPHVSFQGARGFETRYFIQLGGVGLDARAIELVSWRLKRQFGIVAYILATLQSMAGKVHDIVVESGGCEYHAEAILMGNGRFYGGRYPLFPKANLRDGNLDLFLFERISGTVLFRTCFALLTGNWTRIPNTQHLRGDRFQFRSKSITPFQLDGERIGLLPCQLGVTPSALRVIWPSKGGKP